MDLEGLRREISNELQRLDRRRTVLMEKMRNLKSDEDLAKGPPAPSKNVPLVRKGPMDWEEMLAALRCLKCGSSLQILIPTGSDGEPNLGSPRLGQSEGGNRYLECPTCHAKNIFVRTTGLHGWRLLVTQLVK